MNSERETNPVPLPSSRIYASRRVFPLAEMFFLSMVLYLVTTGFRNGAFPIGTSVVLVSFATLFTFFLWRWGRSLGFSIALHEDGILYQQDRKEWRTILFTDIHTVKFYSVTRMRFMKITAGPYYQETGFLVGGVKGLNELKAELKEKLGPKVQETDRWWNKASNLVP